MFEKIKALLTKLGFDIKDKEAELKSELDKLEKDGNGKIDLSKLDLKSLLKDEGKENPLLKTLVENLTAAMQEIKDLKATLGKELTEREAAIKAQQEKTKSDFDKKVKDRIEKAMKEKIIVEADKDLWTGRLTKDYDEWDKELSAKPVPKELSSKKETTPAGSAPATTGNKILDAINQHTQAAAIESPFVYQPTKE